MVMAESNTTPKFLIVADGDISVVPMQRVVPERRDIMCGGEAIKNSVFESLSLSLFFVIQFRISATQRDNLNMTHAASPGLLWVKSVIHLYIICVDVKHKAMLTNDGMVATC